MIDETGSIELPTYHSDKGIERNWSQLISYQKKQTSLDLVFVGCSRRTCFFNHTRKLSNLTWRTNMKRSERDWRTEYKRSFIRRTRWNYCWGWESTRNGSDLHFPKRLGLGGKSSGRSNRMVRKPLPVIPWQASLVLIDEFTRHIWKSHPFCLCRRRRP